MRNFMRDEWTCPNCLFINPGLNTRCVACTVLRPQNPAYELPPMQHQDDNMIQPMAAGENPKDRLGIKKVPLGLMPAAGKIYGAMAMKDGARKYGPYNWREKKVKMTIYLDAIERHLEAFRDGEDVATDSGVPHLGHVIACAAILADAIEGGYVVDDRPKPGPAPILFNRFHDKDAAA